MVQFSHLYITTWKTVALIIQTFVSKVMSLLLNLLSRFATAFLQRSRHLLISWLQSPSTVILELKKRKSVTVSTFPLSICHDVMGLDAMILVFWILSFKPALTNSWGKMRSKRQGKRKDKSNWSTHLSFYVSYLICISLTCYKVSIFIIPTFQISKDLKEFIITKRYRAGK